MSSISTNLQVNTSPPGEKNLASQKSANARDTDPLFRWDYTGASDAREIFIRGDFTGSGNDLLRIPWWNVDLADNGSKSLSQDTHVEDNGWKIDLNNDTITLASQTTGVLDGIVVGAPHVIANSDLLVFALFDPNDPTNTKFRGFGAFHRPIAAYTTHNNGAKGSTTTLTLVGSGINTGRIFTPNARVIVREGITADSGAGAGTGGSPYNQGTITAVSEIGTSITVTLDNVSTHGTALTAATAGTVIQLDRFEPRLSTEDSLYPGGGTEYNYTYMGSLFVDSNQNISTWRKRGDINYNLGATIFDETVSSTTPWTRTMARHIGLHTKTVEVALHIAQTAGAAPGASIHIAGLSTHLLVANSAILGFIQDFDEVITDGRSGILEIRMTIPGGVTCRGVITPRGYTETAW